MTIINSSTINLYFYTLYVKILLPLLAIKSGFTAQGDRVRIIVSLLLAAYSTLNVAQTTTPDSLPEHNAINLSQLYCESRLYDPQVLRARYMALASQDRQREALGQLLPQITGNAQLNRTRRSGDVPSEYFNTQRYTISLSQHIYNKSAWENYKRFKNLARQSELEAEEIQAEAAVELARRYFTALAANDELALVQAEKRTTQKSLDQAQALLARQMVPKNEALQLQARVESLKAQEIEAQNQVTISQEALTEIVGHPITKQLQRIRPNIELTAPEEPMDNWVQRALVYNKSLLAHGYAVEAAKSAIQESKGAHYPTASLNLSSQRSDVGYDNVTAPRTNSLIASVNVNIPIFSGGSASARAGSMYNEMMGIQQQYESLRRELIKQSTSAYLTLQSSVSKIEALRQAQHAATESRIASEAMFERRLINAVDMLNSVEQEYASRRDLLQTHYDFVINRLMLSRWAGSFSAQNIYDVNEWLEGSALSSSPSTTMEFQCH